jgi:alkaline phosphatase D
MQMQRTWLNKTLEEASASVMLVGSGSVLLGRPQNQNSASDDPPYTGYCSGDDWDCYRPAQQNLLGMLARRLRKEGTGCVVILTGDYHHADIKRIIPGENATYSQYLEPPVCIFECDVTFMLSMCTCMRIFRMVSSVQFEKS